MLEILTYRINIHLSFDFSKKMWQYLLFQGGDNFADFSNQSPNFVRPPTHSNRGQQGQGQAQHPQPRGGIHYS